jgi:hypothetical protein
MISLFQKNNERVLFLVTHHFLHFLSFCSLQENEIEDKGVKVIAEALKVSTTLTDLK